MKIIFLRHGQDDDTRRGGWSSYGLLEEGHLQAKQVAEYLRSQTDYAIGSVYASDLKRTMETAGHLAEALQLPVQPDRDLREINNGDLAGMPNEEALVRYPGLFFSTLGMDEPYPNGESPREFYDRIKAWFRTFLEKNCETKKDILVVTHGGVIKILSHIAKGMDWTNQSNTVPTGKCSIHVLNVDTMEFEVENKIVWQKEGGTAVEYRNVKPEELTPALFAGFQRRQEVSRVWRKTEGSWAICQAPRVIENWDEAQTEFICWCLRGTLDGGGMAAGAFLDGKLKGIVAVNAEPLGSRGQYREVPFLQVSRECRSQGIGRSLFGMAKGFARALGGEKLYLSSQPAVESQAFYKAMGCVEAEEYSPVHVEQNPNDCQIECRV